jgi:glycolate oxidase subunit GlcD
MSGSVGSAGRDQSAELLEELRALLGDRRLLATPGRVLAYECDGLTHFKQRPLAVVFPESTDEVRAIVLACARLRVPLVPRGAGTGLSGGATAPPAGVVIEMARMNRILRIDAENRLAVAQPGVVNQHLSDAVRHLGLHYAPDPSSQSVCSLGGNVGENAGGPHGFKYGSTERHVAAVRVVLPDGEVADLGWTCAMTHGLDLRGLFLGSEGTLGIATEITCRLLPIPQTVETLLAPFRTLVEACQAVSDVVAAGIVVAALEALDERTIHAVEDSVFRAGYPRDAGAVLLVEIDGHEAEVTAASRRVREILRKNGSMSVGVARDPEERKVLWRGRKGAFGAMGRLAPDLYVQDAVVPRTKLPEVLAKVCAICDRLGLRLANVFHAGDGNLHPNICYDGRDPSEVERVLQAGREIVEACVAAGGALSGEHGIGLEKREFMPLVFSEDDLAVMARVRAAFDPGGVMNPGKLLPQPRACVEVGGRPGRAEAAAP